MINNNIVLVSVYNFVFCFYKAMSFNNNTITFSQPMISLKRQDVSSAWSLFHNLQMIRR